MLRGGGRGSPPLQARGACPYGAADFDAAQDQPMNFTDSVVVDAPPEAVWRCLAENPLLAQVIPGCTAIRKRPERGFVAQIDIRVGFMVKKIEARMLRRNMVSGQSMVVEAAVGTSHSAVAQIELAPQGSGTRLSYAAEVTLGGMMGSGLAGAATGLAARKVIAEFCDRIARLAASLPVETKRE